MRGRIAFLVYLVYLIYIIAKFKTKRQGIFEKISSQLKLRAALMKIDKIKSTIIIT